MTVLEKVQYLWSVITFIKLQFSVFTLQEQNDLTYTIIGHIYSYRYI